LIVVNKYQIALLATGAALALTALPVHADDRAIAQQVFQEARELMAAGKFVEACPKFAAAAQLSPTAGVRLNLSDCYAALGKVASAWGKADEASRSPSAPATRRRPSSRGSARRRSARSCRT
jgi:thioredoxin-like negative regulator of GroEL